jgi:hypothetical protein
MAVEAFDVELCGAVVDLLYDVAVPDFVEKGGPSPLPLPVREGSGYYV